VFSIDNKKENAMDHDIDKLANNIKSLTAAIDKFSGDDRWNFLLEIIYKNGWTTLAEYRLVNGVVLNMSEQIRALSLLQDTLFEGSQAVLDKNADNRQRPSFQGRTNANPDSGSEVQQAA
jgi:hypothetical protein